MSAELSPARLAEIRGRANAATPGPWMKDPDEPVHIMKPDKPGSSWDGSIIATLQRDDFGLFEESNADLIAHAPDDIAALLNHIDTLTAERDELQSTLVELQPAEVLVEGSFFRVSELPQILGNFMRASNEHAQQAKDYTATIERVRALHSKEYRTATMTPYCHECSKQRHGDMLWPCPTIKALEGADREI